MKKFLIVALFAVAFAATACKSNEAAPAAAPDAAAGAAAAVTQAAK